MLGDIIDIIAYRDRADLSWVAPGLIATFSLIYYLKGRVWAFIYVAIIPLLNWSFANVESFVLFQPSENFPKGVNINPLTMVTGLVFVLRDFIQREIGHKVLIVMALAIAWSFYYSWPVIALASGLAFAISETVDWLLFTFTKYRLSTRILLSSAVAAPLDTTVFLYGAGLAVHQKSLADRALILEDMAGAPSAAIDAALSATPVIEVADQFHLANWVVFVIGKMVGAVVVSWMIRQRELSGNVDPTTA